MYIYVCPGGHNKLWVVGVRCGHNKTWGVGAVWICASTKHVVGACPALHRLLHSADMCIDGSTQADSLRVWLTCTCTQILLPLKLPVSAGSTCQVSYSRSTVADSAHANISPCVTKCEQVLPRRICTEHSKMFTNLHHLYRWLKTPIFACAGVTSRTVAHLQRSQAFIYMGTGDMCMYTYTHTRIYTYGRIPATESGIHIYA